MPGTTVQRLTHFISIHAPEDSILLGSPCLLLNQQRHRAWKTDSRFPNWKGVELRFIQNPGNWAPESII